MKRNSRIVLILTLALASIVVPLGISTVITAFKLNLLIDAICCVLMLCLYIAVNAYEIYRFALNNKRQPHIQRSVGGERFEPVHHS